MISDSSPSLDQPVERALRIVPGVVRKLVDEPDSLVVDLKRHPSGHLLTISVKKRDFERLVANRGRTMHSLQIVAAALSEKYGEALSLEVSAL